MSSRPRFVVSLDFELMWGVRDHHTKETYGRNILGVREAVPRLLEAFDHHGIKATWATVGLIFCENKGELLSLAPVTRPSYKNASLSNYNYFAEVGEDERRDPYYFGLSLLNAIRTCPGQEIGSHTFSHFYCLEDGATDGDFRRDLEAAKTVAARRGVSLKSIVFPRNQYDAGKIKICGELGFTHFRGNEDGWIYRPVPGVAQHPLRRGLRLADSYIDVSGGNTSRQLSTIAGLKNVPSSRFLRPYSARLRALDGMRLKRITSAMSAAAAANAVFHLWWHPHNFGRNLGENMAFLGRILEFYKMLADRRGMISAAMGDI